MIRLLFTLIAASFALAEDATQAINDARDKIGGYKAYSGALPTTVELPGQAAEKAAFEVAYQSPGQLRVRSLHEGADGKESILLVFAADAIWAEGRTEPAGGVAEVRVRKVLSEKIDSFTLGVLNRVDAVEGVPHLLFARPGLLLEFVAQCFTLAATDVADGKELAVEATRSKEPEGLDQAAGVLEGIRKVRIVIAKEDKRLLEVALDGGTGGRLTVSYRDLAWDKAPEATAFEYKAPEGVPVEEIDERIERPGPGPEGAEAGPDPMK